MENRQHEEFDHVQAARQLKLLEQEQRAIAARRQMSSWQIKASYFLAMLNNRALQNGREEVLLVLVPGNPPTLKQVKK